MNEWQIKVVENPLHTRRDIYIFRDMGDTIEFLQSDNMAITRDKYAKTDDIEPTIRLEPEAIQALVDELSVVGYKPLKGYTEGKVEAMDNHLQDLRKLLKLKN